MHGHAFAYYETAGGGMGARNGLAGLSGVHTHMSNTRNTPIEALEQALPVRVVQYALRQSSGGEGQYRGGDGLIRELEMLAPACATLLTERRNYAPYGMSGGSSGATGRNTLIHQDGKEEQLPAKVQLDLTTGDRLRVETPGGGGYGLAVAEDRDA
jgi:N-methylhydantoinase B/oxoprolinase/acetone carboxylase alpha subunit